ncbi:MAG: PHP domain-containing protein [Verrucomicrobiae bacterium]|nr:PHP domain-containing protein [Verrucomicrobiae bacterium]
MTADLHSHTHYSDGTLSPADVLELARHREISILAITDHDTMEGIPEAQAAARERGVDLIPALELTSVFRDQELHLLGYFHQEGWKEPFFQDALRKFRAVRHERAEKMVRRLREQGLSLDFDQVLAVSGKGAIGRPHIARALLAAGQIRSFDEAFSRYLNRGKAAWVEKYRLPAAEAIDLIHRAGGLAVLAHPGLLRNEAIPADLVELGLDGVEAFHTKHGAAQSERFLKWARGHNLLCTGGSDCHGQATPLLGNTRLEGPCLDQFLEKLRGSRVRS